MILAVEGIDGAGKHTLVTALQEQAELPVATLQFPRYQESIHAQLAQEALYGRMGDVTDSLYAMATLFALDRYGALPQLQRYAQPDAAVSEPEQVAAAQAEGVLILDRYIASNAAYSAARAQDAAVIDWVYDLEVRRLGLPAPDLQVLLQTPHELAQQRAAQREAQDATRQRDRYETDQSLQERTAGWYDELAQRHWLSPWYVADPHIDPGQAAAEIWSALNKA